MTATAIVLGTIGLLLGIALGAVFSSSRSARSSVADKAAIASLEAERAALERRISEEAAALNETIERVSAQIVLQGTDRLAKEASQRFDEVTEAVAKDLDLREERFKNQVDPIKELLDRYSEQLNGLEKTRVQAYASVTTQLEALRASEEGLRRETQSLVTALRAPHTRGRWGEMQLRRVVEMAGMLEHCDFVEQVSTSGDDGVLRPDMIVTMPGGGSVVIDAKAPLAAYLDALEAVDETARQGFLEGHARQLDSHVAALSKKAYWEQFESSPDFVVCFVPGDGLLAAAFEASPTLGERAMENRVLLCGPTSLIALLQTISFGWRQEVMAENAREVQALGQELYSRLSTMGEHLTKMGRALNNSVGHYNNLVRSTESRVLVTARRFPDLGVVGGGAKEVGSAELIEMMAQGPQSPELQSHHTHPAAGPEVLHLVEDDDIDEDDGSPPRR